jgi:hypothetical protein
MVMEVAIGVLKMVVASTLGSRWDEGRWTIAEAQKRAFEWARRFMGDDVLQSRWAELDIRT